MNIEQARFNMIEQQIRPWSVLNQEVLDLLSVVRREEFVPAAYRNLAFMDIEIPLPCGQNMLTPKMEARVLQAVAVNQNESVLEIGAGSGYMAALLAYQARNVITVEIEPELKAFAEHNLDRYGVRNSQVVLGNGGAGWLGKQGHALYDVIVLSGSVPVLHPALLQQLKLGGRLLAFVGDAPLMSAQLWTRTSDAMCHVEHLFETCVMPLHQISMPSHFMF